MAHGLPVLKDYLLLIGNSNLTGHPPGPVGVGEVLFLFCLFCFVAKSVNPTSEVGPSSYQTVHKRMSFGKLK